jgi:hypothetical protein
MYQHLSDDTVIKTAEDESIGAGTTFVLNEAIAIFANNYFTDEKIITKWTETGIECQVLMPNSKWQKGKVRISIEFEPDQETVGQS